MDEPLQVTPDHTGDPHGSVVVKPSLVQVHIVCVEIDWTLVAAINAQIPSSWAEGHIEDGRILSVTVVKHKGAHVTNGLPLSSVICKYVKTEMPHKLDGTVPIEKHNSKECNYILVANPNSKWIEADSAKLFSLKTKEYVISNIQN